MAKDRRAKAVDKREVVFGFRIAGFFPLSGIRPSDFAAVFTLATAFS
jgi:hypothetical protein